MPGLRASAPRGRGDRPTEPWRPGRLQVHGITRRTQKVWETDGRTGEKVRRARPRFAVAQPVVKTLEVALQALQPLGRLLRQTGVVRI